MLSEFLADKKKMRKLFKRTAYVYHIPRPDVEDVMHDAIILAFESYSPNNTASFDTHLYTVLNSVSSDYYKYNKHRKMDALTPENQPLTELCPERISEARELLKHIVNYIYNVRDEQHKYILTSILIEGKSYDEIECTITNPRDVVSKFRQQLREEFGEFE